LNYHTVSWNSEHNANRCIRCGHLSYGSPKTGGYDECIECKKIHLLEVQNDILQNSQRKNVEVRNVNSSVESNDENYLSIKNAIAIFIIRIFVVFLIWDWILPKKISDAAGVLAVGSILVVGKFFPHTPYLVPSSKNSWTAHLILFLILAVNLIRKFLN
jgi:hypothetical protein